MFYPGNQIVTREKDFIEEISAINGEMDDIEARITLAKFLRHNLGFTLNLMTGFDLTPLQEIIIRGILKKDNGVIVCSRGFGKSIIISVLAILYPLFFFNSKMCLISGNFRGSRRILEETENIINSKKAKLIKQCFTIGKQGALIQRAPDMYRIKLPEPSKSEVFALPLSDGLRGTRATFVCVDEGLLVDEETQKTIIQPFLTARLNAQEEIDIKEREDQLIKEGIITEADRVSFPKNKYYVFSSASYQFQYLYTYFNSIIENTKTPPSNTDDTTATTYFAARFSYESIEEGSYLDKTQINAAASNGGEHTDYFKREYKALFTDSSDGYFNVRRLHDCTYKRGSYPCTQIIGDKDKEYILAIDPSYSSSKNSDYFAMAIYLLDKENRQTTLVHTYGRAGGELKEHHEYLTYLLNYFNIVLVMIDASGDEFIHGYNESSMALDKNLRLNFLDAEFDTDDLSIYSQQLKAARNQYNLSNRTICYRQKFTAQTQSIRRMNEHLKNMINAEKVWFASACCSLEAAFKKYAVMSFPYTFKDNKEQILGAAELIEYQDEWVVETKSQIALIEVSATSTGVLQYDIPPSLRRQNRSGGDNRVRRDHYTCALMANWGARLFFDMMMSNVEEESEYVPPLLIR